jgi:hypothetical protein
MALIFERLVRYLVFQVRDQTIFLFAASAKAKLAALREVISLTYAMADLYCASYARPPRAVTLDIDDTVDIVHGNQQLSLFNAHYDELCFLPIHICDPATPRPVAVLLRPGKTSSGAEILNYLRRLVRRIRSH